MLKENAPLIDSVKEMQVVESSFSSVINPTESAEDILFMAKTELFELQEAMPSGNRQEIGAEIADVILLLSKLATYYSIPLNEAISSKIARNFDKYNPYEIKKMVESGMESKDAVNLRRSSWDRAQDKRYSID